MKINQLHIVSFGKFNDKTIQFSDGFNVIYGLNEAGKSTVHAFIEAMLYGFIDVSKNRKSYLDKYDIYFNETLGVYGGYLTFTLDGTTYSLFRNLKKNVRKDALILTIEKTGKDITSSLDIDPISKQPDIAKFIGLPYLLYKNTLSIAQLNTKTSSEASDELVSRLQNLSTSKSESISAQKALDNLKKAFDDIGSDLARTKPYKLTLDALSDLKEELNQATTLIESVQSLKVEHDALSDALTEETKTLENLNHRLKRAENTTKLERFKESLALHEEINALSKEADALNEYATFNQSDYERYLTLHSSLEGLKEDIARLKDNQTKKSDLIHETYPEKPQPKGLDLDTLSLQLEELSSINEQIDASLVKDDLASILRKRNRLHNRLNAKGFKKFFRLFLKIITLGLFKLFENHTKNRLSKLDKVLTIYEVKKSILNTYAVTSLAELKALYDDEKTRMHALKHYESLQLELETLKQELSQKTNRLNERLKEIDDLNHTYKIDSLEGFKAYKECAKKLEDLTQTIRYKKEGFNRLLKGETLEALKSSIDESLDPTSESPSDLRARINNQVANISQKKETVTMLKTSMNEKLSSTRSVEAISYDITLKEEAVSRLKTKRENISGAQDLIARAVEKVEAQFAPVLNETIKQYLNPLTLKRYEAIKVRKDLTFTLYSPESMKIENDVFFSSGTLDQIYLSIRLGIIELLNQQDKPLILDDVFTNYDELRLKQALKLLTAKKTDQVLLFTCHKRESNVLKQLDKEVTYLEL